MNRYLYNHILTDLAKKMVFITGPRQVGKTWLAKQLMRDFNEPVYLNFDDIDDARTIKNRYWPRSADLIVFDEIHKMTNWKIFLKGTYDTKPEHQAFLVTGSARLETFRQTGKSLAGRYFHYHLNPLSLKEVATGKETFSTLTKINRRGGFPEPFLAANELDSKKWRRQYYTDMLREDIPDATNINELRSLKLLVELLNNRTGSPISYTSLAEDIQISPNSVKKYISILQSLYLIFAVHPFHKNIARALKKQPKIYFYDSGYIKNEGARFENTVAVSLLKDIQYRQDVEGEEVGLHYLRNKDGREIDFVITSGDKIKTAIEVKLSDFKPGKNLRYYQTRNGFANTDFVQLVFNLRQSQETDGITIYPADKWLYKLKA